MNVEFIDSNILVYAHDPANETKHKKANLLIERLEDTGAGALSTQVLSEFYSVCNKKLKFSSQELSDIIADFSHWKLHRPTHADILNSIILQQEAKISWWDALLLNSAIQIGATVLWSEDFQTGRRFGGLQIKNPFLDSPL
jgi:predicted nucleic acid-binding protein